MVPRLPFRVSARFTLAVEKERGRERELNRKREDIYIFTKSVAGCEINGINFVGKGEALIKKFSRNPRNNLQL